MKLRILEGTSVYENGVKVGPLDLQEGQASERFVIIESASLTDLRPVELTEGELKLFEDKAKHGLMAMEGRFQFGDKLNANNRIYPDKIWEKILAPGSKWMKRVQAGEMIGEADHPKDGETLLKRAAIRVTDIKRNPNNPKEIMGRCVILNTRAGQDLKAIHEGGGRIGVSSRGQGSVVRLDGHDVVQDDFDLETWDAVYNPSTHGAFPEEVKESREGTFEPTTLLKESTDMDRLAELQKRLEKWRGKDHSSMSLDAIGLLREELNEIQDELTEGDFGAAAPKATKLVLETERLLRRLDERKAPEKPSQPLSESTKPGQPSGRPGTAEGVAELIESLDLEGSLDLAENTSVVRSAYRDATGVEGSLQKHELDGIALAAKALAESVESYEKEVPEITVTIRRPGLTEGKDETFKVTSERELAQKLQEKAGDAVIVEVDRSEAVFAQCADRFGGLLEAQTLKAKTAEEAVSAARNEVSEMSTKLATAKQFLESMAVRVKSAEGGIFEAKADGEAAVEILEAVPELVDHATLRGAVAALAATHPHLDGLAEALSHVDTIEEAIKITQAMAEKAIPDFLREPVTESESRDKRVEQALNESRRAEAKQVEESKNEFRDKKQKSLVETTINVVDVVKSMGGK